MRTGRLAVDVLMRPPRNRWAAEYAAHVSDIGDWYISADLVAQLDTLLGARPHKFRPEDDLCLLDLEFDDD